MMLVLLHLSIAKSDLGTQPKTGFHLTPEELKSFKTLKATEEPLSLDEKINIECSARALAIRGESRSECKRRIKAEREIASEVKWDGTTFVPVASKSPSDFRHHRRHTNEWNGELAASELPGIAVDTVRKGLKAVGTGVLSSLTWLAEGDFRERTLTALSDMKSSLTENDNPGLYSHRDFVLDHAHQESNFVNATGYQAFWELVFDDPEEAMDYYGVKRSGMPWGRTIRDLLDQGVIFVSRKGICIGKQVRYPVIIINNSGKLSRLLYKYSWEEYFSSELTSLAIHDCLRH